MAESRQPVRLVLSDNFSGRMRAASEAAAAMNAQIQMRAATWEPHDWSDWEA
jgi:hypothetical protein